MDDVIEKIKEFLSDDLLELKEISRRQTYITVSEERHFDFCKYLFEELGGRFATATGMDTGDGFEVLYHFCFDSMNREIQSSIHWRLSCLQPSGSSAKYMTCWV